MLDVAEIEISEFCNSFLEGKARIRMLEAGCGSASRLKLKAAVDAVGIDISCDQLVRNTTVQEKILADIQDYPLPRNAFDVAVCWWVLEHLARPHDALTNLFGSLKQEGLLILVFPNLLSLKGMATKFAPFWFHKLYYRLMKWKSHPFRTYLRRDILPKNLIRFAQQNGFSPVYFSLTEADTIIRRARNSSQLVNLAYLAVASILKAVSFGRLDSLSLECCAMILKKQGMSFPIPDQYTDEIGVSGAIGSRETCPDPM